AMDMKPGLVATPNGKVTCDTVIRATEGFTATLPGQKRTWLPLNSAQIVTEPLPASLWAEIGWNGYELLGDMANAYCYCQRTDDGRIAVGGRGIPYKFGSKIDANGTPEPGTIRELTAILHRLFPMTKTIPLAHVWQGVLGVPRDWCATVGLDAGTRIGWAGGYVGVGVSSSNVAGRTLRDLVLGYDTPLTALPWVNRRVRSWEPEPIRWASVRGMYGLLKAADKWEAKSGARWSPLSTIGNWIKGG
ncbi:MAG: NAD(P)/FAD-dependent oxidoreductase, partial [Planktomarina sp.]